MSELQERDIAYFERFVQSRADTLRYPPIVRVTPIDITSVRVSLTPKHQYYVEPLPLMVSAASTPMAFGVGLRELRIELKRIDLDISGRVLISPPQPLVEMIATPEQRARHQEQLREYERRAMPIAADLLRAWEWKTDVQRAAGMVNALTKDEKRYMHSLDESGEHEAMVGEIEIYEALVAYGLMTKPIPQPRPYRDDIGRLIFAVYYMTEFGRLVWRYLHGDLK